MADTTDDEKLREMAEHRGLKLVKSRRRKPGVGDYGEFGLTDPAGKPLLGIGDNGLEASADDIETYLRAGAASTWKASAEAAPAAAPAKPSEVELPRKETDRQAARRSGLSHDKADHGKTAAAGAKRKEPAAKPPKRPPPKQAESSAPPARAAEPKLVIRVAKPSDAAALASLLRQLSGIALDEGAVARNLKALSGARAGMLVADLGDLIGCCGWAVLPTLQHGAVGRLTVLLVDETHRRRGIGTALLDAASTALRKAGCTRIEAMSDIAIRNAHNFFRTLQFEQTSYRFVRQIETG